MDRNATDHPVGAPDPYAILAARIRTGAYLPGSRLPSERALSQEIGVHRSTLRRALARLADDGLLDCQPGRQPIVRDVPAAPDGWRTVAFLMGNEPSFHAFNLVLRGCEPELRQAGHRLAYMDTWGPSLEISRQREHEALGGLLQHPVAGLIIWCQDPPTALPYVKRAVEHGIPVVAIDREIPGCPVDYVGVDNVLVARMAVEHLLELGHRRIAFATGVDETTTPPLLREDGYRETMHRYGLGVDESLIYRLKSGLHDGAAMELARRLKAARNRPTAIFAMNDILAWRLVAALRQCGLRIPEDVAVIGVDDIEDQSLHAPILSTIRQPLEAAGMYAARLLLQRIQTPTLPVRQTILQTNLIRRASTMGAAAEDGGSDASILRLHGLSLYREPGAR
ncbi:MAG TPA: GntR family transcriptional regulator [Armatimonadota bacterium]